MFIFIQNMIFMGCSLLMIQYCNHSFDGPLFQWHVSLDEGRQYFIKDFRKKMSQSRNKTFVFSMSKLIGHTEQKSLLNIHPVVIVQFCDTFIFLTDQRSHVPHKM